MADGDLVMLMEDKQLRKLAKLLRNQEEPLMLAIKSEPDRIKFLDECNSSYEIAINILDLSIELRNKYEATRAVEKEKADIATNIEDYVKYGINMGLQCVRNCGVRLSCVEKIKEHFDELAAELKELDSRNVSNVQTLAEEVLFYKQSMLEYANNCRSTKARAYSRAYSIGLKQEGIEMPNLVNRHKNRLGYKDEFEFLEEYQKLEVHNSIIKESGRTEIPVLPVSTRSSTPGSKAGGIAALAMSASMMVWDIFTAEQKVESAVNTAVSLLAEAGSFAVQVAVNAAVTTAVAKLDVGVLVVSTAGFVAGAVAGLLFAVASGALLAIIFGTGGKVAPNLDSLKFYSVPMPDGMALANELSHG